MTEKLPEARVPVKRIRSVLNAVTAAMVIMVLMGLALLAYTARLVDREAPRSAVEFELRRAEDMAEANPDSLEAWLALGAAQSDAGSYSSAIRSLQRVLDADPENEDAWMEMGQAYRRQGDDEAAIAAYEEALTWAQTALETRRAELEAKGITQEMVLSNAGARACIALAELYTAAGDFDRARAAAQTLIDDNPMDASAFIALGEVEEAAGDTDAAVTAYRRALQFLPGDTEITSALDRLGVE